MSREKKLLFITFISLIILALVYKDQLIFDNLEAVIQDAGYLAPLVFFIVYCFSSIVLFPVLFLTIASGALFGPYWGTLYSLCSATIAATITFMISRYFLHDYIQKKASLTVNKVIKGVNEEGWQFIAFIRLVPVIPFVIANYALGLTSIRVGTYTLTNFIFMLPGTFAYSYLGYLGKSAAHNNSKQLISDILIAIALFATTIFIAKAIKKYRSNHLKK